MLDILLNRDGDLHITETGDISLTQSVRQAVKIRLLWFFREWRFAPQNGVPYYEEILVKNPNLERIRRIVKNEVQSVAEVTAVRNIRVEYNNATRQARIFYFLVVGEETYREEVVIDVGLRYNTAGDSY